MLHRIVLLLCLLGLSLGAKFNRTKIPGPPQAVKRSLMEITEDGDHWSVFIGCSFAPDEVQTLIDTFYAAASLASSPLTNNPGALPCYVDKYTGNVARTKFTLACYAGSHMNQSRLVSFLQSHPVVPMECRDRVLVDRIPLIHVKTTQATPGTSRWHMDRLDQRGLPLSHSYTYTYTGANTSVYILDTGVWCGHNEFTGRCSSIANFYDSEPDVDGSGHGTHCAGLCCGATFGPARSALIKSCRCLGNGGFGTFDDVVDCLMLIEDLFVASPHMAIVSMSLSGGVYSPVNNMVNTLAITHGVPVVVAAGNAGGQVMNYSPGSAAGSTVVAASTIGDFMPSWSNRGTGTDIVAPGDGITSALTGTTSGTTVKSGTSMAMHPSFIYHL
jgi:subtilisin family serine protease